jgi:hypothetical protein
MKNSHDTIGNQTRDLPVRSAVPQPTAPPAACPQNMHNLVINFSNNYIIKISNINIIISLKKLRLSPPWNAYIMSRCTYYTVLKLGRFGQ